MYPEYEIVIYRKSADSGLEVVSITCNHEAVWRVGENHYVPLEVS